MAQREDIPGPRRWGTSHTLSRQTRSRWPCCWVRGGGLLAETAQVSDAEDRRDCSDSLTETGLTPSSMEDLVELALDSAFTMPAASQQTAASAFLPLSSCGGTWSQVSIANLSQFL
ncbi:unnamed protein product [Coccothraustes coccothraustes]